VSEHGAHYGMHDRPEIQAAMRAAIAVSRRRASDQCLADCGVPLDPVIVAAGWGYHPGCDPTLPTPPSFADSMRSTRSRASWRPRACR
jgi:hypothetical protein